MKESDRIHLTRLAYLLERGQMTRSDVIALFMILRGSAGRGSIVRDIGDCVAHDERDRGDLHSYAHRFVSEVRRTIAVGGVLESKVLYPVHELLDEIGDLLEAQAVTLDRARMESQVGSFVSEVAAVLDGVTIKVQVPHVTCRLLGGVIPGFAIDFLRPMPGGVIKIPGPLTMLFPMFRSESPDPDPAVVRDNQAATAARDSSRSMFERAATKVTRTV